MSLGVTVVLQAALLATGAETYSEAHKATTEKGYPLVVMVGATWCPACQQLKERVMPEVRRRGLLRNVAFAQVDLDEEGELGKALTNGGPIPQIVLYRRTPVGWLLRRLVGGQDARTVEKFISEGIKGESAKPSSTDAGSPAEQAPVPSGKATRLTSAAKAPSPGPKAAPEALD